LCAKGIRTRLNLFSHFDVQRVSDPAN